MNEELQKALAEILNSAIDAKDFLLSEMPDVINQLLWWHGVKSGILCFFGVFVILAAYKMLVKTHRKIENNEWDEVGYVVIGLSVPFVVAVSLIEFINLAWLQILIAPKLYLIEYAAKLVG